MFIVLSLVIAHARGIIPDCNWTRHSPGSYEGRRDLGCVDRRHGANTRKKSMMTSLVSALIPAWFATLWSLVPGASCVSCLTIGPLFDAVLEPSVSDGDERYSVTGILALESHLTRRWLVTGRVLVFFAALRCMPKSHWGCAVRTWCSNIHIAGAPLGGRSLFICCFLLAIQGASGVTDGVPLARRSLHCVHKKAFRVPIH